MLILNPQAPSRLLKYGNLNRLPLESGALHRSEGHDQGEQCFGHAYSELFPNLMQKKDSMEKDMITYLATARSATPQPYYKQINLIFVAGLFSATFVVFNCVIEIGLVPGESIRESTNM